MRVAALWRYPVKAMLGEAVEVAAVGPGGLEHDRRWAVVDASTGRRIASKRGPTDPRLRACRAQVAGDGALRVRLPHGAVVEGTDIEPALSALIERPVRLEEAAPVGAGGGLGDTSGHHDAAPVHLLTTGGLARLRALEPSLDWDARRFRANVLLDDGDGSGAFSDAALTGARLLAAGGLQLDVVMPTPRCVVVTRPQPGIPAEPGILRAAARHHRLELGPLGHQPCVGAYAEVRAGGRLRVGDALGLTRDAPAGVALTAALTRLAG